MLLLTLPGYSNLIFIVCSRRHQGVNDGIKPLAKNIAEREAYQARSFVGRYLRYIARQLRPSFRRLLRDGWRRLHRAYNHPATDHLVHVR
jgi:hypothetical protein